jgi:hypothetical protein
MHQVHEVFRQKINGESYNGHYFGLGVRLSGSNSRLPDMRIDIILSTDNLLTVMRRCGYAPEGQDAVTGELKWTRPLVGRRYPRFHVYSRVSPNNTKAILELHLDQKQPSYEGSRAHSGEYDGPVVERESRRIQQITDGVI